MKAAPRLKKDALPASVRIPLPFQIQSLIQSTFFAGEKGRRGSSKKVYAWDHGTKTILEGGYNKLDYMEKRLDPTYKL